MIKINLECKVYIYHLRQNNTTFIGVNIAIVSINIAVMTPKNPAAPRPLSKFFPTMTKPLASAKSAIHQIANHKVTTPDKM